MSRLGRVVAAVVGPDRYRSSHHRVRLVRRVDAVALGCDTSIPALFGGGLLANRAR